jgi:hypothetical protein
VEVCYYTDDGQLAYFPASWTDTGEADPFVVLSGERAVARFEDFTQVPPFLWLEQRCRKDLLAYRWEERIEGEGFMHYA